MQSRCGVNYRTTKAGYDLLKRAGYNYPQDAKARSNGKTLDRRVQMAEILLFFHLLHADVFMEQPYCNSESLAFLPAFALRRQEKSNLLNSTRLTGFFYTHEATYIPYYVTTNNTGIYPHSEEMIFTSNYLCGNKRGIAIYIGQKHLDLLLSAAKSFDKAGGSKAVSYWDAMQRFSCPVCFIPLSEEGLRQLRIMTVPGYREKLCRYLLGSQYHLPENQWHDAVHSKSGERYQIGIDFNLKDFDKGLPKHLIVLEFQKEPAQRLLLGKDIILHTIQTEEAEQILELPGKLPNLSAEPYRTKEGGYLTV